MEFINTSLPDAVIIKPRVYSDGRGFFLEYWHRIKFRDKGIDREFVQDNHSRSSRNVLRGLHYQVRHTQGKLVKVISGEIFDVAVDLRRSSPHFGKWEGVILSSENKLMFWVPEGFAHGFLVISREAEVLYKCTDYYMPECERTIRWDDPEIGIQWPIEDPSSPLLSTKDAEAPLLKDAEIFP